MQRILNENKELLNMKEESRKKEINNNEIHRKNMIFIETLKKDIEGKFFELFH